MSASEAETVKVFSNTYLYGVTFLMKLILRLVGIKRHLPL